jgi:hypothetical protein
MQYVIERGRATGFLTSGDRVVFVSGTGLPSTRHNMIIVHQVD